MLRFFEVPTNFARKQIEGEKLKLKLNKILQLIMSILTS